MKSLFLEVVLVTAITSGPGHRATDNVAVRSADYDNMQMFTHLNITSFTYFILGARCSLPPETGPCEALIQRYFHNATSRKCERFTYGGCEGNSNNFIARYSCERACGGECNPCLI